MDTENSSTDEEAYACDKCERRFNRNAELTRHKCVRMHTRLNRGPTAQHVAMVAMRQWPYRCHVCGHRCTNGPEMAGHMKQRHWLKSGREPCVCRTCLKAGWIRVPLGELQRRAEEQSDEWQLGVEERPDEWQLGVEERPDELQLQAEERPDESLPRAEERPDEWQLPAEERPDEPPRRAEDASEGSDESPREGPSTAVKRRQCPVCGRLLASKANMIVHVRSHTGERPFQCKTCDKRYPSRDGLRRHEVEKHAAPKCAPRPPPARRRADDDGPVVSVLAEDETVVRVLLRNRQVSSVPVRKEPVVMVSEDDGGRGRSTVVMAVVPDTSFRAPTVAPAEWPELVERTVEYAATAGRELSEFVDRVCRDQPPPPPPDDMLPTLPCALDELRVRGDQVEVTEPATGARRYRCHVCRKDLKRPVTWRRHLARQHGYVTQSRRPRAQYACNVCPATARTRDGMREHMRTAHGRGRPRKRPKNATACPLCPSVLYDKFSLVRHARLKHGFPPDAPCFACSVPPAHAAEFGAYLDAHSSACQRTRGDSSGPPAVACTETLPSSTRAVETSTPVDGTCVL